MLLIFKKTKKTYIVKDGVIHYYRPVYNNYSVTKNGKIFNSRGNEVKGTEVKGYLKISVREKRQNPKKYPVHKFVWELYNNEENNDMFNKIHIDGNKLNNKVKNLKQVLKESSNPINQERRITATNIEKWKTKKI